MSWNRVNEMKSGGDYVKIEPGEKLKVIFRGEPYIFFRKYPDKTEYPTKVGGSNFRFRIGVVIDGEPKKMEQSYGFLMDLADCKEKYGLDCVYEVKRTGSGRDTRYSILFDRELKPEELKEIDNLQMPALTSGRMRQEEPPPPSDDDYFEPDQPDSTQEDVPF